MIKLAKKKTICYNSAHMKKILQGTVAAWVATTGICRADNFEYGLPDSGLCPSFGEFTYYSRLRQRHGGSDVSMRSYALTLPLADPRKTSWYGYRINAQLDTKITGFTTGGTLDLKDNTMYNVALPVTFIQQRSNGNTLTFGAAPEIATDGNAVNHGLDLAAYGLYSIKVSDTFNYTIGAAASPRFAVNGIVPIAGFEWRASNRWTLALKGYQFSAMYHVNDHLDVGAFARGDGGIWAVETARGDEHLRMRSLIVGLAAQYDFSRPGQSKRVFNIAIGTNVATRVEFTKRNADKDSTESHHYKPGFYISVGVDFRF